MKLRKPLFWLVLIFVLIPGIIGLINRHYPLLPTITHSTQKNDTIHTTTHLTNLGDSNMAAPYGSNMLGAPGNGLGVLAPGKNPFLSAVKSAQEKFNATGNASPYSPGVVQYVQQTPGTVLGANTGGGGGGAAARTSTPAVDPTQIAQYDQAIGTYENQINRLPSQLAIAQGNINTQYGQQNNELQSAHAQAENTYNTNTGQNQQQYVTNKNQINDTASAGLRGLLRTLGAYGAGGGSDARYVAPNAVATQASQQRAGAGETFGQNQNQLDTSWGNYGLDYGNSQKKLEDWRTQQLHSAEQTSLGSKQTLLSKLAELRANRAAAAGGNAAASAQPYLDQAQGLQGQIDQLGALNPTYTGSTPVYNAPSVASYTVDPNATTQVDQSAQDSIASPYLQMLLGKNKKQLSYA